MLLILIGLAIFLVLAIVNQWLQNRGSPSQPNDTDSEDQQPNDDD